MIERITAANLAGIANPALRAYAQVYVDIEASYREGVAQFGLPFAEPAPVPAHASFACPRERAVPLPASLAEHEGRGLRILNDGKSLVAGWQSSACEACRMGLNTETFVISLRCPRRCFFCFNPNQADYEQGMHGVRDVVAELEQRHAQGRTYTHLALTGGEPLLFLEQSLAFFRRAKELFPGVHTRLYTSGYGADEKTLRFLREAGLDEIRYSVKTDDPLDERERVLASMALACAVIPDVMVEMPVMPGELDLMKDLLLRLDAMGVRGINLLELGFPLYNAPEFALRGLCLKHDPHRVLYSYSYAGGLPIDGSERACLELLSFALDRGLGLGVHYCSMENKHTGQVFHQNAPHARSYPLRSLSRRDFFYKSVKAFGRDRAAVRAALRSAGAPFEDNDDYDFTEFAPESMPLLREAVPHAQLALSYAVCENRDGDRALREVRVDLTTPATFDYHADL